MQNMNWNYPTNVWFGPDRSQRIQQACDTLGVKNPLIVTDPGLLQTPIMMKLILIFHLKQMFTLMFKAILLVRMLPMELKYF